MTNPAARGLKPLPTIVVVGPRVIEGDVVGGTKIMFEGLLDDLSQSTTLRVVSINISRPLRGKGPFRRAMLHALTLVRTLTSLIRHLPAGAVMYNASSRGTMLSAPAVWLVTRLYRTPLVTRVFGGGLGNMLAAAPGPLRWIARRTFLRSELLLLETPQLCRDLADCPSMRYFPNTRNLPPRPWPVAQRCRRFLMLAQLRPEKGVAEAVAAANELPTDCSLTLHGHVMCDTDLSIFEGQRAQYRGALPPNAIPHALWSHDALILPTYHEGEGLAGVILEAFQAEVPVITTDWQALPELVRHEECGLIVPPRSTDALASAMVRLAEDESLFRRLRDGARARGEDFRRPRWYARLEGWLMALATGQPLPNPELPFTAMPPPTTTVTLTPQQQPGDDPS